MKFALTLESNFSNEQSEVINDLSIILDENFMDKSYGNVVKKFYIGIICVKPEFDIFFKERRIKYDKNNCLSYDIKFDYSDTIQLFGQDLKKTISIALIESLEKLKKHKKIKDFDFESFQADFKKVIEVK